MKNQSIVLILMLKHEFIKFQKSFKLAVILSAIKLTL